LKYDFQGLSFSKNEQKEEPMLQRNPNGRIPFLTDYNYTPAHEVFESASVNLWLAENYDKVSHMVQRGDEGLG
jgi:glutathione S-transferase